MINAIIRIKKRLGGLETKTAVNFLIEDNTIECFRVLLKYYDKWYLKGLENRDTKISERRMIPCKNTDPAINIKLLLNHKQDS